MAPSPPLQSSGTVTLSPWRQKEPDSDSSRTQWKVSNSTITSELSFRICNVPWMELFIWSCSTEANHCIKTSSRVTCGSYLSLQLPDTFPPNHTCRKQRITFHSGVSSSHVVIPYWLQRLVVVTARRHCWKWHWQIITHQCVWQCQHIWLAQTRAGMRNQTFFYFFLVGHSGDWLVILSHHLHNLILRYNVKLFTPHPWSRKVCFKFPSFIRPCQPSVLLSSYTQPTHQHTHTCACDLIYHDCWDRCLPVCWKVKVHICVPKGKCAALERLCSSHPVSTC